ncbi:MAG TPA: hypothetical protein VLW85_12420 [Myxococcales bacterium]|nr:hypothetical protein [Myxococcales bacterium]
MTLLSLLLAATPALVDAGGTRLQLDAFARWPAAALIDASGAVRGVLHLSEQESPRLDVFDGRGKRRVIVRREGALPLVIFLDARERPRLRVLPSRAQLLDERGRELAAAEAEPGQLLSIFAGGAQVAAAEQDDAGASAQLGSEERPAARLGLDRSGWRLSIGGGRLALLDAAQAPRERGPGIGPLRGVAEPARSRFKYEAQGSPPRAAPSSPWEPLWIDFDVEGPTSALSAPGPRGPALRLVNARPR